MRILLFAMPETEDFLEYICQLPNLGIISLAGSLPEHEVHTLDLILIKDSVKGAIADAIEKYNPDIIGLSAMTFQFDILLRMARFIRSNYPEIQLMAGGYHATLMYEEITEDPELPLDFLVRGEGEITVKELIAALENDSKDLSQINGLSYRSEGKWDHNEPREVTDVALLPLPDRDSRIGGAFHVLGKPFDVIETSRGCPNNCNFCCITHMYGRSFRPFPFDRVIEDLTRIKANGSKAVFIIDDNITHSINHFKDLCKVIIDNNFNTMQFMTQVTAAGIAKNPDLVALMDKANFRMIFVGFESMEPDLLQHMRKPTSPEINREAARLLRKHKMGIIAGAIVGFPDDTRDSIKRQLKLIRSLTPDGIYVQYLTPYPKTRLREEMIEAGLVVNKDDFSQYTGFNCVVKTKHLSLEELYRAKKVECLKPYFNLKMVWNNYFIRNLGWPMVVNELRTIKMLLLNILTLKQHKRKTDI